MLDLCNKCSIFDFKYWFSFYSLTFSVSLIIIFLVSKSTGCIVVFICLSNSCDSHTMFLFLLNVGNFMINRVKLCGKKIKYFESTF